MRRKFPKNANKCETPPPCSACLELLPMPQTFFREFPHRAQRRAKPEGDARPLDAAKLGARAETSTFGGASAAGLDVGNHFRTLSLVPLLPAALRGWQARSGTTGGESTLSCQSASPTACHGSQFPSEPHNPRRTRASQP